jgi:alpha-N-arabinofuranosidase
MKKEHAWWPTTTLRCSWAASNPRSTPAVNAGSATFPVDVVAAWTADHRTLTVAVLNPTDADQPLTLHIAGAPLTGKGTLWRLAPNGDDIQHPDITSSPVASVPDSLTLPRYSINIYELTAK